MKGKIAVSKVNLMGYTPETQVFFVQNAGGDGSVATATFLQAHRKLFDQSLFMGRVYFALNASRIAKFRSYAEGKGFEITEGATV